MSVGTVTLLVVAFLLGALLVAAFKRGKRGAQMLLALDQKITTVMDANSNAQARAANVTQVHVAVPGSEERYPALSETAWDEYLSATTRSDDLQHVRRRSLGLAGDGVPLGVDPGRAAGEAMRLGPSPLDEDVPLPFPDYEEHVSEVLARDEVPPTSPPGHVSS